MSRHWESKKRERTQEIRKSPGKGKGKGKGWRERMWDMTWKLRWAELLRGEWLIRCEDKFWISRPQETRLTSYLRQFVVEASKMFYIASLAVYKSSKYESSFQSFFLEKKSLVGSILWGF